MCKYLVPAISTLFSVCFLRFDSNDHKKFEAEPQNILMYKKIYYNTYIYIENKYEYANNLRKLREPQYKHNLT